jgi:hypothetical protein
MMVNDRLGREDDGADEKKNPKPEHSAHAAYNVNYECPREFRLE